MSFREIVILFFLVLVCLIYTAILRAYGIHFVKAIKILRRLKREEKEARNG
ncbi:MAG: hypothetical protein Q8N55_00975 [bacterium]|nr:hypothetical protein [bacterium]